MVEGSQAYSQAIVVSPPVARLVVASTPQGKPNYMIPSDSFYLTAQAVPGPPAMYVLFRFAHMRRTLTFFLSCAFRLCRTYALTVVRGPDRVQYKDARIRVDLRITHVAGATVRFPRNLRVAVTLEDSEGNPIYTILRGPHAGSNILQQSEFSIPTGEDLSLIISNIRVREVARNHGSREFQLHFHLPEFRFVAPARSRLFMVRSERLRSPSYTTQLEAQRTQRRAKGQADPSGKTLAATHEGSPEQDDDSDGEAEGDAPHVPEAGSLDAQTAQPVESAL